MTKPVIALDCDGVLLDYCKTFGQIYQQTFGKDVVVVNPRSFDAKNMYGIEFTPEEEIDFYTKFDEHGWHSMPMLDGALEACDLLHEAGYELVCVTTMSEKFVEQRLRNLKQHGFKIDRVIGRQIHHKLPNDFLKQDEHPNPKKEAIEKLKPVVFVDDLKRNFKDIQCDYTKFVYIDGEHTDDHPNLNDDTPYHYRYRSLIEFVKDFLKHEKEMLS
ncbi:unnamed protein product [Didymodactylos carnosus]|uniref:Uncharacterized protein n=1 Tax=Didymodactylos carnosus TaxID=1234261 RepID=A0A814WQQ4_9BILA|nr:unnamed protein product [Didymodactylos carnosus]CAF1201584.1 unnamed protein product [Didymodactylos carnosus]CAF3845468.1 unnamed protein product [Didymodactylos carnosus]CAF3966052.1 unnamed protein product [Didymodactylos carnosus]